MGSKMRADEYPQGAGRICNAPSSRTAALGIGPYRVRRMIVEAGGQSRPPLQGAAFLTLSSGEGDADIGALAVDRIDADRALMLLQNLLRDGQA